MNAGQRELLSSFIWNGATYNIYLQCTMDGGPWVYHLCLCKGDWQCAAPNLIASPGLDDTDGKQKMYPDPKDYVIWAANILEEAWKKEQGGGPVPVTWQERLEAWLKKVAFFRNPDGTEIIKLIE